ncbi:MAG: hypothetical protein DRN24_03185 [Thermoplasmata archaeon]|nr:MAG: hypothetical protein DRN24_03185 [Thermoplasmata archaeon]
MRKKLVLFIIVMVTIVNLISGVFIFLNIQFMKIPEVSTKVDIVKVGSDEGVAEVSFTVFNSNGFDVVVENVKVVMRTSNGTRVGYMEINGGVIPSWGHRVFNGSFVVDFHGCNPRFLNTRITGDVGVNIGFIRKTMPLSVTVVSILGDAENIFTSPALKVDVDFSEITQKGVNVTLMVDAYNPNMFDIVVSSTLVEIRNETGGVVGDLRLPGFCLSAKETTWVNGSGMISIEALNAEVLTMNMSTVVSAIIAGFNESLSFYVETRVETPDLETLLSSKFPTEAIIRGDYRFSLRGFVDEITIDVYNPNNIELMAKDVTVLIARSDHNKRCVIATCDIADSIIKANTTTTLKGEVVIPYRKLLIPPLDGRFIPDWLEVTVRANVTIQGLNKYIWVGVTGCQDIRLWTLD